MNRQNLPYVIIITYVEGGGRGGLPWFYDITCMICMICTIHCTLYIHIIMHYNEILFKTRVSYVCMYYVQYLHTYVGVN